MVSVDFCQIELRILAHLSKDPILLSAIKSPGDIFLNLSAKWYKITETEVCLPLKIFTFIIYRICKIIYFMCLGM